MNRLLIQIAFIALPCVQNPVRRAAPVLLLQPVFEIDGLPGHVREIYDHVHALGHAYARARYLLRLGQKVAVVCDLLERNDSIQIRRVREEELVEPRQP